MLKANKNILLVDDDNRNIFALSAILKAKGFTVDSAGGMKEAFDYLEKQQGAGVILLDMMMPEMYGYEALSVLINNSSLIQIAVIAVTAQATSADREKCMAAGADEYISKPVDIDALLKVLTNLQSR